jgi:hypothetical protein
MKAHEASGGTAPPFLTLALDGGEETGSLPEALPPGREPHVTYCIRDWVGPRAG